MGEYGILLEIMENGIPGNLSPIQKMLLKCLILMLILKWMKKTMKNYGATAICPVMGYFGIVLNAYSPLPERPRLSLRTINRIQSGMLVRKCISGEKSDIVLSNHNYGGRQIKAK